MAPYGDGDKPDASDIIDSLEPEVSEGPFGLPIIKPKGAPDLPGPDADDIPLTDVEFDR